MKKTFFYKLFVITIIIFTLFAFYGLDFINIYSTNKGIKNKVTEGTANKGNLKITGNVKEYIDDSTNNNISNVKIEIYDENGEVQLYDAEGNKVDAIYSDEDGNYTINNLEGVTTQRNSNNTMDVKAKEYTVKFTYGTKEQLEINKKYNGQDYEVKQEDSSVELITISEEVSEITKPTTVNEDDSNLDKNKKIDLYFVLDCSGSMMLMLHQAKQTLKNLTDKLFETYGDNIRIGVMSYGREMTPVFVPNPFCKRVMEELPLSNKEEVDEKLQDVLNKMTIGCNNYNDTAIHITKELLLEKGRSDSEKYIIMIGDGIPIADSVAMRFTWLETRIAYEIAQKDGINMFSIIVGNPLEILPFWALIMFSLAETDWYCSLTHNTDYLLEYIAYQYLIGNRSFVKNFSVLPGEVSQTGEVERTINISKGENSVAIEDDIRRQEVNSYTKNIDNNLRNENK